MYANIPPLGLRHNLLAIGLHERALRSPVPSMVTLTQTRLSRRQFSRVPPDAFHRRIRSVLTRARIHFPDDSRERFPAVSPNTSPWLCPPPRGTDCSWPNFRRPEQEQKAREYAHSLLPVIHSQSVIAFTDVRCSGSFCLTDTWPGVCRLLVFNNRGR